MAAVASERGDAIRTIKDEGQTTWFVGDDDPATPLCKALDKAGFEEIALPRETIVTGVPVLPDPAQLTQPLAALSLLGHELPAATRRTLVRNAEHNVRVFLCARTLLDNIEKV